MKDKFTFTDEVRTVSEAVLAVFIALKLTDVITWSWFWVLSPFWISFLIGVIYIIIIYILYFKNEKGR